MVQEPSFFTFAGQEVRRLRSRSVAVMVRRSPAASKRKLDRIGMVVLRSTTPCVAVSSRNSSDLLTVISIETTPRRRGAAYYASAARCGAERLASVGGTGVHPASLVPFHGPAVQYLISNQNAYKYQQQQQVRWECGNQGHEAESRQVAGFGVDVGNRTGRAAP